MASIISYTVIKIVFCLVDQIGANWHDSQLRTFSDVGSCVCDID